MKAIELSGLEGFKSLRVADVEKPKPAANQILIEVMAAGINFAELELTWGRYPALKPLPYVLGFAAADMRNMPLPMLTLPFRFPVGSPLLRRAPSRFRAYRRMPF